MDTRCKMLPIVTAVLTGLLVGGSATDLRAHGSQWNVWTPRPPVENAPRPPRSDPPDLTAPPTATQPPTVMPPSALPPDASHPPTTTAPPSPSLPPATTRPPSAPPTSVTPPPSPTLPPLPPAVATCPPAPPGPVVTTGPAPLPPKPAVTNAPAPLPPVTPQPPNPPRPEVTTGPTATQPPAPGRPRPGATLQTPGNGARPQPEAEAPSSDPDLFVDAWWNSGQREVFMPFGPQPADRIAARKAAIQAGGDTVLAGPNPTALRVLDEARRHPDYRVRVSAALKIGEVGGPAQAPLLTPMLRDRHEMVRAMAALALGLLGDRSQVGPLAALAADGREDVQVRGYALVGIGFIGRAIREEAEVRSRPPADLEKDADLAAAAAAVRRYLRPASVTSEKAEMAVAACVAAEQLGDVALAADIIALTAVETSKNEEISSFATAALGQVRGEAGFDRLMEIACGGRANPAPDKRDNLRASAYLALGQFTGLSEAKGAAAVAKLVSRLNKADRSRFERDLFARNFLIIAVARLGADQPKLAAGVWTALRPYAVDGSAEEMGFAAFAGAILAGCDTVPADPAAAAVRKEIAATLAHNLDHQSDKSVMAANAAALGLMKEKSALPRLRVLARKYVDREDLVPHLLPAIARMGDDSDAKWFQEVLATRGARPAAVWNAALGLALLYEGREPAPIFRESLLVDRSPAPVRKATVTALGASRNAKAISLLAEQFQKEKERNDFITERIVFSLGEIESKFGCSAVALTARGHNFRLNSTRLSDLF